jgi:hypothetical protein
VGIVSGFVVAFGLLTSKRLEGWTALFLATTVATSVTGFLFPFQRFLPSHGVGIVSLLVLPVAIVALYRRRLAGYWRPVYVVQQCSPSTSTSSSWSRRRSRKCRP